MKLNTWLLLTTLLLLGTQLAFAVRGQDGIDNPKLPRAQSTWQREMAALPPEIRHLAEGLQGKKSETIQRLIVKQFGPPIRQSGSGNLISEWDVAGGVLTFQLAGEPLFKPEGQSLVHLIRTIHPVKANICASYEMTTVPFVDMHNSVFGLGNVTISKSMHYHFADSKANLSQRSGQQTNFFMLHPDGTVLVAYPVGITPASHLEDLADQTTVANLTFIAGDGSARQNYALISRQEARQLVFSSKDASPFEMARGWATYAK